METDILFVDGTECSVEVVAIKSCGQNRLNKANEESDVSETERRGRQPLLKEANYYKKVL